VDPEEDLLGHLLGLGAVAEHPHRHPEDPVLVEAYQLLEGPRLAGPQPLDEPRVVPGGRLTHG
jgi:hypothetical protein